MTFRVLAVQRRGEADGDTVLERLRELDPGRVPSLPALYRSIRTALEAGWIEIVGTLDDGTPGRPRKIFKLTAAGGAAAEQEAQRLTDLAAAALDDSFAREPAKR